MFVDVKLFLYLFSFFSSFSLFSFTLTQRDLQGFKNSPLSIHIEATHCDSNTQDLIDKAIDIWNGASQSSLKLKRGNNVTYTTNQVLTGAFNEEIIAYCSTDMQTEVGSNPDVTLGVGTSQDLDGDNHIDKGILVLNYTPGSAQDFNIIDEEIKIFATTHEIGHVLGLGHTSETSALMYYDASQKENVALHQDDIDGIRHLYPQNELEGEYLLGCAKINISFNNNPPPPPYLVLLALSLSFFLLFVNRESLKSSKSSS